jgi:GNAT superfamily N-acetyltransferase
MQLEILKQEEKNDYIEFLVKNFLENADETALRSAAEKEIDCMFSNYFRKPIFYCYKENGKLIATSGIIREWVAPNTYSIFWVCVDQNRRGEGIGTQIMNATTEKLSKDVLNNQPGTLMLYCLPKNCAFYETLGYEKGPIGHKFVFMSQALNIKND